MAGKTAKLDVVKAPSRTNVAALAATDDEVIKVFLAGSVAGR